MSDSRSLLIDTAELARRLASPDCLVFDVRHDLVDHAAGRRAYEAGHVPGARFLDHETELSAPRTGRNGRHPLPARDDFAALMRAQGLTPDSRVVVYDGGNSMMAAHLWWMLRWLGHEAVVVLDGGWAAWVAAGGEVQTGAPAPAVAGQAAAWPAQAAMPLVDVGQVESNLQQPRYLVVDARAPERYRGEVEPMDPVAGHIPGARNRASSENLGPEGRYKPASQLREEFLALLGGQAPETVVHQCGSGITACHNLLAMELAGLHGSALYPGSWSEWCSDPARPVARGTE